ncbi:ATP-binding cassette domain-containing protein [Ornithinimicrobium sp. LYQ92]|uniref:ATP-binding cassette domain-containing protein n=1 Tax=Serinicoccus sp. LYQ92 TaxID=3378798 RepID=UPI0038525680
MIEARGLTKDFVVGRTGKVHAVRAVDLHVDRGETVAILGPNGAGKTTTMRMLTTLLTPTAGSVRVAGFDVAREPQQVRHWLGYVGQGNGAGHGQRAADELVCQGVTFGMSRAAARGRAAELMGGLDLAGKERAKVSELSGGQRRRLDVAMGLMHAPELLVLDEPSTGLDPHNRANLWEHIRALREQRRMTLLLTTHYLDEADAMAERVVIVDHGQVIADDSPERLKSLHAGDRMTVTTTTPEQADRLMRHLQGWAAGEPDAAARPEVCRSVRPDGSPVVHATLSHGSQRVTELVRVADADGIQIQDVQVRRPTLDDVFLNLTGRSLRAGDAPTEENAA